MKQSKTKRFKMEFRKEIKTKKNPFKSLSYLNIYIKSVCFSIWIKWCLI